jgi:hypothetical protein
MIIDMIIDKRTNLLVTILIYLFISYSLTCIFWVTLWSQKTISMLCPFITILAIILFIRFKIAIKYRKVDGVIPLITGSIHLHFMSLLFRHKTRKNPLRFLRFDSIIKIFKKESNSVSRCEKCKNNTFVHIASERGDENNKIRVYCTHCKNQHHFDIEKNNFITILTFL